MSEKPTYRDIYRDRDVNVVRELVEVLVRPPERPLTENDKKEVYAFEQTIGDKEVIEGLTIEDLFLDSSNEDAQAPQFFAAAFIGEQAARVVTETGITIPPFQSHQEVYVWLATTASNQSLASADMRKLAAHSLRQFKDRMASSLVKGSAIDEEWLDVKSIVLNPEEVLRTAPLLARARTCLFDLRRPESDAGTIVGDAKVTMVDLYIRKLNMLLSSNTSLLNYISEQAEISGDENLRERALSAMHGKLGQVVLNGGSDELFSKLDRMRTGMNIGLDSLSGEVEEKILTAHGTQEPVYEKPFFTPEQVAALRAAYLPKERVRQGFENILKRAGVLSSVPWQEWAPERKRPPHDGGFQVVEDPTKSTFTVIGSDCSFRTPNVPTSLFRILSVGGSHELTHIDQVLTDKELGKKIRYIKYFAAGGSGVLREGGANARQRASERVLFGEAKPVAAPTYLRALQALRAGGTIADAAKAFYEVKCQDNVTNDTRVFAVEAADRVLRLNRFNRKNTVPMEYALEGVLLEDLRDASIEGLVRAGQIDSLDLATQARLHEFGLLTQPDRGVIDWVVLTLEEFFDDIVTAMKEAMVEPPKLPSSEGMIVKRDTNID